MLTDGELGPAWCVDIDIMINQLLNLLPINSRLVDYSLNNALVANMGQF